MLDPNTEHTQPTKTNESFENTQPVGMPPAGAEDTSPVVVTPEKIKRWPIILGGIVLVLILAAGGAYLGYRAAIKERVQALNDQSTNLATEQFMLGVQEQDQGLYDLAIRRYEYVIQLDPNFPGVKDKLAQSMLAVALLKTPTITAVIPTPTIAFTPTPDLRGEDEIFNNARSLLANKEWVKALEVLDTLRTKNINYHAVEVDGMYYVALRNRGMVYINSGRLESGLYDLALTERFGPLDIDANGLRTWARMYLTGASFWGVRWDKVVEIFAQIYPYYPNLHDINGFTAAERFRKASLAYGDQFAAQKNYCDAYKQYKNAQDARSDPAVEPTMKAAYLICYPPTATPTVTPTKTLVAPTDKATVPPVEAPTNTPQPPAETSTQSVQPPTETPTNTVQPPAETPTSTNTPVPTASETPKPP